MGTDKDILSDRQDKASGKNASHRKISSRQIAAMTGVILLALLYLITLAAAILDSSASGRLMWMCLFATIAIPILIWIYIWMYGKLTGKKTMNDPDFNTGKDETGES